MNQWKQFLRKRAGFFALCAFVMLGMTSCQREGCPGAITRQIEAPVEQC